MSAPPPVPVKPPEPDLPAPLASWLSGLEDARRTEAEDRKGQQQQIVYLLAPQRRLFDPDGSPTLAMTEADLEMLFAPS